MNMTATDIKRAFSEMKQEHEERLDEIYGKFAAHILGPQLMREFKIVKELKK